MFSLTNNLIGIAIGVGRVVVSRVVVGSSGASSTAVDVATGAVVAADDNDAVSAVIPPSSTKDKDLKGPVSAHSRMAPANPPQPPCCCYRTAAVALCAAHRR